MKSSRQILMHFTVGHCSLSPSRHEVLTQLDSPLLPIVRLDGAILKKKAVHL
jgi:hypothetical protein